MSIDFACKKFNLEEVIRCGLGLTKSDLFVLRFFNSHSNSSFSTEQLQKHLSLDLSTIQRSVKKLKEKGVLSRSQTNLSSGGYLFKYQSKPKSEIKRILLSTVHNWVSHVEKEFDRW